MNDDVVAEILSLADHWGRRSVRCSNCLTHEGELRNLAERLRPQCVSESPIPTEPALDLHLFRLRSAIKSLADELENSPDVRIPVTVAGPMSRRLRALLGGAT